MKTVCSLVKKALSRTVRDRLGELRKLLHAERVSSHLAIAHLAQPNVKQRFVRAFKSLIRRQSGQLSHVTYEAHTCQIRDEGIALRHVAYESTQLAAVLTNILAEDSRSASCRRIEP